MIIKYNKEEWKPIVATTICSFHKEHPFEKYAGCGCSKSYSLTRKPDWEILKDKLFEEYGELFEKLADM